MRVVVVRSGNRVAYRVHPVGVSSITRNMIREVRKACVDLYSPSPTEFVAYILVIIDVPLPVLWGLEWEITQTYVVIKPVTHWPSDAKDAFQLWRYRAYVTVDTYEDRKARV